MTRHAPTDFSITEPATEACSMGGQHRLTRGWVVLPGDRPGVSCYRCHKTWEREGELIPTWELHALDWRPAG